MDNLRRLSREEMAAERGGEALTLSAVMAILAIAIVVVVCYRLFNSSKGSTSFPGGFRFDWGK